MCFIAVKVRENDVELENELEIELELENENENQVNLKYCHSALDAESDCETSMNFKSQIQNVRSSDPESCEENCLILTLIKK